MTRKIDITLVYDGPEGEIRYTVPFEVEATEEDLQEIAKAAVKKAIELSK